jgi:hypothetical protein
MSYLSYQCLIESFFIGHAFGSCFYWSFVLLFLLCLIVLLNLYIHIKTKEKNSTKGVYGAYHKIT